MASSVTLYKKKYKPLSLSHRHLSGDRNTKLHILLIRTTVILLLLSLLIYNISNVYVYLGEIDLAKKFRDTTTTSTDNGHCIFVMNKLYGNHTLTRVNKGLDWYKTITLQSIGLASQYIDGSGFNNTFVAIILSAEGAYYESASLSLKGFGNTDDMPHMYINSTEMHNIYTIPYILQEQSCNLITIMRVDADDMIYPDVFEYILQGWEDIDWRKQTNSTSEGAMVIGGRLLTKITLASSPSLSSGDLKCSIERKQNGYFNSAGLSVTLPVSVLEEKYSLNPFIIWSNHVKLANKINADMEDMGLQTVIEDYPKLGVATSTQLSGHFNRHNDVLLQDCNETYLISAFKEDIGSLIWSARDAIPKLRNGERMHLLRRSLPN